MYNVLIVDDKEIFCRTLMRMPYLRQKDRFNVKYTASNGFEALEYLRNEPIDVTLTDIRMPLMDGIELLKTIRGEKLCHCTVLFSEHADFMYAKEGIINGAFDFLVKPVENEALEATFDRIYDYLNTLYAETSVDPEKAEILTQCILSGEPDALLHMLAEQFSILRSRYTLQQSRIYLNNLLQKIQTDIRNALPYITLYVPLNYFCQPAKSDASPREIDYREQICRLMLLQEELRRFHFSSAHPLIRDVQSYILQHIEECCKLQTTAEHFFVNKNYLSTLFRKECNEYYKDFVASFKIERAKLLLSYMDMKIYTVAETLQFGDAEYFSRVFRSHVGTSPSRFDYVEYLENRAKEICEQYPEIWLDGKGL